MSAITALVVAGCADPQIACQRKLDDLAATLGEWQAAAKLGAPEANATRADIARTLSRCSDLPLDSAFSAHYPFEGGRYALTLLDLAVFADDAALVRRYLDAGISIFGLPYKGHHAFTGGTSLRLAAALASYSAMQELLKDAPDVSAPDDGGRTPLMGTPGYLEAGRQVAQLLIDRGADIDARDKEGDTALSLATRSGDIGMVQLLLRNGANVSPLPDGMTLKELALRMGHDEIATLVDSNSAPKKD
jgi:ankyrin repeat protein